MIYVRLPGRWMASVSYLGSLLPVTHASWTPGWLYLKLVNVEISVYRVSTGDLDVHLKNPPD